MTPVALTFRELAPHERAIIRRILDGDPEGARFREQVGYTRVAPLDAHGSLAFEPAALEKGRVQKLRAEAQFLDDDGIHVHVLLFHCGKELFELQVYKDDGTPISRVVTADQLELLLV